MSHKSVVPFSSKGVNIFQLLGLLLLTTTLVFWFTLAALIVQSIRVKEL